MRGLSDLKEINPELENTLVFNWEGRKPLTAGTRLKKVSLRAERANNSAFLSVIPKIITSRLQSREESNYLELFNFELRTISSIEPLTDYFNNNLKQYSARPLSVSSEIYKHLPLGIDNQTSPTTTVYGIPPSGNRYSIPSTYSNQLCCILVDNNKQIIRIGQRLLRAVTHYLVPSKTLRP